MAIYESTGGESWSRIQNWSSDTSSVPDAQTLDAWDGVTVDMQAGRVSGLDLAETDLTGEIPSEIGNLTGLVHLAMWRNNLEGGIPAELGNLTRLDTLGLFENSLSGAVPAELGNLVNLRVMELQDNRLIGPMPETLMNLSKLEYLNIDQNQGLCFPVSEAFQAWLLDVDGAWGPECSLAIPSHIGARIGCTNGAAAAFSCNNVEMLAHLAKADLGAEPDVLVNDIWGWTDSETNRDYALVAKMNSVAIVDVTDPVNPVYLGTLPSHDPDAVAYWRDVKVYRNHMYVVADAIGRSNGMQVFDLTRLRAVDRANLPVEFVETANYRGIGSAHNVFVHKETGYAYVTAARGGNVPCGLGLHIVDIRNPAEPVYAGCHNDPRVGHNGSGYAHDVQCVTYQGPDTSYQGREICIAPSESAITVVDVTNKSNTQTVAIMEYPQVAYAHQGWLTEDHRYFLSNDELDEISSPEEIGGSRTLFWDLADLNDPVLLHEYTGPVKATDHNLYIRGDYAYLTNYKSGLRILDIEDIMNPVEVAYFDTDPISNTIGFEHGAWSSYPFFESGIVVVSSQEQGLHVLRPTTFSVTDSEQDASTPEAFTLHGNYPNPFNPSTRIAFDLPAAAQVSLLVYDVQGKLVRTVQGKRLGAGERRSIEVGTEGLASGTYLYRLTAVMDRQRVVRTGMMTLLR